MDDRYQGAGPAPAAENPAYALPQGTVLNGRYRVERMLGKGGFGITYKARDLVLNIPVAVKEYFPDMTVTRNAQQSPGVLVTVSAKANLERDCENFLEEARRLGQFVSEPGVVGVRDFFKENGTAYIVMEYLSGETLRAFLDRRKSVPMAEALALLGPVMHSLDKVHAVGLIHRDISPENIFLTPQGAKLLDFGTARPSAPVQNGRTVLVKPGYAPAEQYDSESSQGPWSDVYSLSAVLYECITGTPPQDSLRRMFTDTLAAPSALGVRLTPAQDAALMKGLAIRREERYQTVRELAAALGAPGAAPAAPTAQPVRAGHTMPVSAADRELLDQLKARQTPVPAAEPVAAPVAAAPVPTAEPVAAPVAAAPVPAAEPAPVAAAPVPQPVAEPAPVPTAEPAPVAAAPAPAAPVPPEAGPQVSAARKRRERREKNKKGRDAGPMKKYALLGGGVLAAVAVVLGMLVVSTRVTIYGVSYTKGECTDLYIEDKTITAKEMKKVCKLPGFRWIGFTDCSFEEGCLEPLSGIETLYMISSYGTLPDFSADFPYVTNLVLSSQEDVNSLDFLDHFPGLQEFEFELDIFNTESVIKDFSPIGERTGLKRLFLGDTLARCGQTDLSFLSGLTNLTTFQSRLYDSVEYRPGAGLSDISPLANCPQMTHLYLDRNNISDLRPLASCPLLEVIEMNENSLTTLTGLEDCTELRELFINDNQVESLEPLAKCEKLYNLKADGNRLTTLAGLENAKALDSLDLNDNQISDLSALTGTEAITWFTAENNRISDLTPLAGNGEMQNLYLNTNALTSLAGCERMVKLQILNAAYNQIEDLSGIANCSVLNSAGLSYNRLHDVSPLANNGEDLQYLEAAHNEITTLKGLESCTNLQAVNLCDNAITDLSPLANSVEMTALCLQHNQISSLAPLSGMTQLAYLDVWDNQISSLAGMENMTQLSYADLSSNRITSLDSFPQVGELYTFNGNIVSSLTGMNVNISGFRVFLEHNQITDLSPLPRDVEYSRLSVYDNPLSSYETLGELTYENPLRGEGFYFSYRDGLDLAPIVAAVGNGAKTAGIYAVDVPLDKQGQWDADIKKDGWADLTFLTMAEADEILVEDKPDSVAKAVDGDDAEQAANGTAGEEAQSNE